MRVLVVDDDAAVRDSLARTLRFEGYQADTAADGRQALDQVRTVPPDLMILDVSMPVLDGLQTCRLLRAEGMALPVLMLTARDSVGDRVAGLDAGADDYLVKPFALQELLARVRAMLRRSGLTASASPLLTYADVRLDPETREVWRGDQPLKLTRTEFGILEVFLRHPKQVLSRAALFEQVWGYDFGEGSNSIHVYLGYLRRKLGEPRLLHTVRGVGFVLREDPL
ncbi:DNA-binding response regulator [Paractinoplanes abujensis]|uniref:Two-component system response regulator MprA n=1 Tax=Paractinoplanes abujensis TaxID=882441 RepID=A0A7W7CME4_9ACTN|nr:response regulator transcription factor [Actinoplanes abujensis]MBB4691242.1 two-component system response regulator MprA [Actinoplanes abujensis]GID17342.1 DNA-binding response regulator [Actinoplanes abujensis]